MYSRRQEEQLRVAAAAEARRQEHEREERERRRAESELAAMKERHLKERMAHISQTAHGQKMLQKLDEEVLQSFVPQAKLVDPTNIIKRYSFVSLFVWGYLRNC